MADEIVGREDELSSVLAILDRVRDGARALVLEGQAGIGKTTLWDVGVEAARARAFRVLTARPAEAERELGYAALGDLLGESLDEVLPALSTPRRRALEAALLVEDEGDVRADARAVAVAVHDAVRLLAGDTPVLVAVDDAHWLDASTSTALAFAFRRLGDAPVLLLLARRAGAARSALDEAVEPAAARVVLGPLSLGAVQVLLRAHLGRVFPRPLLRRVHEVSGGNPFYALELARALARSGEPVDAAAPLPVPESLERLVDERLRTLPDETRRALLVVAAVGAPTASLLEALGISPAALQPALDREVAVRIGDEIRFTHPLLASGLAARASPEERRAVHRRIAGAVREPVEHARHLALGLEGTDAATAALLEAAAGLAHGRAVPSVAAELAEAAARATPPQLGHDARRRLASAARDHLAAGAAERALELARRLVADAPPGRPRAESLALLGELEGIAGDLRDAVAHLREALAAAAGVPEVEALVHEQLAQDLRIAVGLEPAERHAREAVATAQRLGDDALTARALAALATARFNRAEPDAYEVAARALELARRGTNWPALWEALTAYGHCFVWSGRLAEARRAFGELRDEAADRDEPVLASALWYLSITAQRAGELAAARRLAEESRTLGLQYGGPDLADEPTGLLPLARVAMLSGDHEQARALAERALAYDAARDGVAVSTARGHLAVLAVLDFWSGDAARAVERFAVHDEERRAAGFARSTELHLGEYAEALLALGRADDAEALLDAWDADARAVDHLWAPVEIARCRALAAAARGEVADAVGLLADAAAGHERVGDPFGRARALLALGSTLRRLRRKRPAREAIEEALALFEEVGARFWAERARAELGRIGGRTRIEGLTPAELRVARLAAEGRTNREVAAALFLGERTVETHLSHVYAKLGIRSRTELARTLR
ncbi:MAG: ATP-binding protein [Pseudomonadota bacterium]